MSSVTFFTVSLLVATVGVVSAQDRAAEAFCRTSLSSRPFPEFSNSHEPAYLRAPDVRALLWDAALARYVHLDSVARGFLRSAGDYVLQDWYIDTQRIADSLRRRVAADSGLATAIALKLAEVWDAGAVGATEGMAYVAASLYRDWHLPPAAALRYLADPAFTPGTRAKAVRALEAYWKTPEFHRAAAAALCSLAARVVGLVQFQNDSSQSILDSEEYELFGGIMWALGKSEEDDGASARDVLSLLPPDNVLTRWTQKWLTH